VPGTHSRMSASSRGWIVFALVACAAAAADLLSKQALFSWLGMPGQGRAIVLVPGYLVLETNLNEGALFGMG
jgi:signal peptidase II